MERGIPVSGGAAGVTGGHRHWPLGQPASGGLAGPPRDQVWLWPLPPLGPIPDVEL